MLHVYTIRTHIIRAWALPEVAMSSNVNSIHAPHPASLPSGHATGFKEIYGRLQQRPGSIHPPPCHHHVGMGCPKARLETICNCTPSMWTTHYGTTTAPGIKGRGRWQTPQHTRMCRPRLLASILQLVSEDVHHRNVRMLGRKDKPRSGQHQLADCMWFACASNLMARVLACRSQG